MADAPVEASVVGIHRDRPPLGRLALDVRLRNERAAARWFLIPDAVGAEPLPTERGIWSVAPIRLEGRGTAIVASLRGVTGLHAVLVPPGGDVSLHGLPLQFAGSPPAEPFPLDIAIARSLEVDGTPVAEWVGAELESDASADASFENAQRMAPRSNPHFGESPVSGDVEERLSVELTVP